MSRANDGADATDSMMQADAAYFEREYNARLAVPEHPAYFQRWAQSSAEARAVLDGEIDLRYGPRPKQTLDIFPAPRARGLLLFIHGGYWRALDKADFSWIAPPYIQRGVSVAVLNYDLCPTVSVDTILSECREAIVWLCGDGARHVANQRLVVSGHSAGGHLTAMMLATDWHAHGLRQSIAGGVAISGLFDLEPFLQVSFNADLKLDAHATKRLSPIRHEPTLRVPLILAVGAKESGEFKKQSQRLFEAWSVTRPSHMSAPLILQGRHHFDVLDEFVDERSMLFTKTSALFNEQMGM